MRKRTNKKGGIGSAFDDFLKGAGTYEATETVAIKRVLAYVAEHCEGAPCPTSVAPRQHAS